MVPAIVLGDKTTGGGVVIEGSPNSLIMGKPIARFGDKATCQIKGHPSIVTIIDGDTSNLVDGKPTAFHMSSLSCGCKVIGSQSIYLIEGSGGGGGGNISQANSVGKSANSKETAKDGPDEQVRAIDHFTNEPIPDLAYFIQSPDGTTYTGHTDANGLCERIITKQPESLSVWFGEDAEKKKRGE